MFLCTEVVVLRDTIAAFDEQLPRIRSSLFLLRFLGLLSMVQSLLKKNVQLTVVFLYTPVNSTNS